MRLITESTRKRFWQKVDIKGEDDCWPWLAGKLSNGYGRFWVQRLAEVAHRVAYRIHYGAIDERLRVLHTCDNRSCQNPRHLFQGTQLDNIHDMIAKGRARTNWGW
jgi:hypothetical protein